MTAPVVRNNAPVPLEPALEHQVLAIAAHTGVSRAEVIQEMVRDRLKGGTFRPPFPFPRETSGRQSASGADANHRPANPAAAGQGSSVNA